MSGKSTIGKALSEKIKYAFNDMDNIIEDKYKRTASNIFETLGEEQYRLYERECLEDFSGRDKLILSTGVERLTIKALKCLYPLNIEFGCRPLLKSLLKDM